MWTDAESILVGLGPWLTGLQMTLSGGVPTVTWTYAGDTAGVRVEFSVGTIGHSPSYSTDAELPVDYGPYTPSGVSVSLGQDIYVRVTPFETFAAGSVGGDSGPPLTAYRARADSDAPAFDFASVARSEAGDCDTVPLTHRIEWGTTGSMSGHTVTVEVSIDGAAYGLVDDGLGASGPLDDEYPGEQHDLSDGVRTEYDYRIRIVRTSDSAVVGERIVRQISYAVACES